MANATLNTHTTLKDRVSGRVLPNSNPSRKPYLLREEEKELVEFVIACSKLGYGKTRGDVLSIVEATLKKKGRNLDGPISNGWLASFS